MRIIDTTLREGEQTAGVVFSSKVKREIVHRLVSLGVDEIELGAFSTDNPELVKLIKRVKCNYPDQQFSVWCRCLDFDIHKACLLRPDVLALSIPVSDLHLVKKLGKDRQWASSILKSSIKTALNYGVEKVAVGFEDASRADPEFIQFMTKVARQAGAFRVRLADTVGVATPPDIIKLLDCVKGLGIEVGFHCHNDFGMATANIITAFKYGAEWGDATILGLGERAGGSRLEEVAGYLVLEKDKRYNLKELTKLSHYLAKEISQPIARSRPIIGAEIFTCETGIHLHGLACDPATYEPFAPESLGMSRKIRIGQKAGKHGVAAALQRLGVDNFDESRLVKLTRKVRRFARSKSRSLTDSEIIVLAHSLVP